METSITAQWLFFQLQKYIKPNFIPYKPCQANWVSIHMCSCIYWFLIYSRLLQTRPENWVCHSQWTLKQGENICSKQSFVLNLRRKKKRPIFALSLEVEGARPQFHKSAAMANANANEAARARTSRWAAHLSSTGTCKHIRKAHWCTSGWGKELRGLFLRVGKSADHQGRTSLLRLLR